MAAPESQVLVAAISTGGGVLIAYLTLKYKDRLNLKTSSKGPKDRMETIFDGYESLIKELKDDSERKSRIIDNLQTIVDSQRKEIEKSQELIDTLRGEVTETKGHARELKYQLDQMKEDYQKNKEVA